jgi:hypothetical protein
MYECMQSRAIRVDSTPFVCLLKELVERAPSGLVSLEERRIDDFRQRGEQLLSDEAVLGMVDDLRAGVHGAFAIRSFSDNLIWIPSRGS